MLGKTWGRSFLFLTSLAAGVSATVSLAGPKMKAPTPGVRSSLARTSWTGDRVNLGRMIVGRKRRVTLRFVPAGHLLPSDVPYFAYGSCGCIQPHLRISGRGARTQALVDIDYRGNAAGADHQPVTLFSRQGVPIGAGSFDALNFAAVEAVPAAIQVDQAPGKPGVPVMVTLTANDGLPAPEAVASLPTNVVAQCVGRRTGTTTWRISLSAHPIPGILDGTIRWSKGPGRQEGDQPAISVTGNVQGPLTASPASLPCRWIGRGKTSTVILEISATGAGGQALLPGLQISSTTPCITVSRVNRQGSRGQFFRVSISPGSSRKPFLDGDLSVTAHGQKVLIIPYHFVVS